jgi:hypothetical protein
MAMAISPFACKAHLLGSDLQIGNGSRIDALLTRRRDLAGASSVEHSAGISGLPLVS